MCLPWGAEVTYFVTICERDRRRMWARQEFFTAFEAAIGKLEERHLWFTHAAVVMPDHLHLLATPMRSRDDAVGNLSGALKRWTRSAVPGAQWNWQAGAFDRLLRPKESASRKWEYIRENPVRAGLVKDWRDWPFSIGIRDLRPMEQ